ncbi:MAG: 30S ribosome-binding factor RbfA [Acidimicrobiales bacterium]|jgi:ribosome-binding factor A
MARRDSSSRGRRGGHDPAAGNRTAKVGGIVRRLVAERMELIDDDRLTMVSITGVDVDRDLYRAVVWFTSLDDDHDPEIAEAFEEHGGKMRHHVATQSKLRRAPILEFRPDVALRSGGRIEEILRASPVIEQHGEPQSGDHGEEE